MPLVLATQAFSSIPVCNRRQAARSRNVLARVCMASRASCCGFDRATAVMPCTKSSTLSGGRPSSARTVSTIFAISAFEKPRLLDREFPEASYGWLPPDAGVGPVGHHEHLASGRHHLEKEAGDGGVAEFVLAVARFGIVDDGFGDLDLGHGLLPILAVVREPHGCFQTSSPVAHAVRNGVASLHESQANPVVSVQRQAAG